MASPNPQLIYLNFVNQAPVFLLGCHLYFHQNAPLKELIQALSPVFTVWVIAAFGVYKMTHDFRGFGFLLVMLALYCLVLAVLRMKLQFSPVNELGRKSYSIYLTHEFVLYVVLIAYTALQIKQPGYVAMSVGFIAVAGISYLLATALYQLIEKRTHRLAEYLVIRGEERMANRIG